MILAKSVLALSFVFNLAETWLLPRVGLYELYRCHLAVFDRSCQAVPHHYPPACGQGSLGSDMSHLEDLNRFMGEDLVMEDDESPDEEDDEEHCGLPIENDRAAHQRRISLSSLWPPGSSSSAGVSGASEVPHRDDSPITTAHAHVPFRLDQLFASSSSSSSTMGTNCSPHANSLVNTPGSSTCDLSLDMVFPSARGQILKWHPNRVFFAVTHLVSARLSRKPPRRRRVRSKRKDAQAMLRSFTAKGVEASTNKCGARHRGDGRDLYRRIVGILTGIPRRQVALATQSLWQDTNTACKDSWGHLAQLFQHGDVRQCVPEFLTDPSLPLRRVSEVRQANVAEVDRTTWRGYGFSLVFNTPLGQDDVQVIRLLQDGLSGHELRKALADVPCYAKFMDKCWNYFESLGKENGFPLVACGLEHSENGSHPARVHVHVYMGMEVRGAFFANNAAMGSISHEKLLWAGLEPGFVRPTIVLRRAHAQIHKAVIQAYYYVAGPKTTQILLRSSAKLHTDTRGTGRRQAESEIPIFKSLFCGVSKLLCLCVAVCACASSFCYLFLNNSLVGVFEFRL